MVCMAEMRSGGDRRVRGAGDRARSRELCSGRAMGRVCPSLVVCRTGSRDSHGRVDPAAVDRVVQSASASRCSAFPGSNPTARPGGRWGKSIARPRSATFDDLMAQRGRRIQGLEAFLDRRHHRTKEKSRPPPTCLAAVCEHLSLHAEPAATSCVPTGETRSGLATANQGSPGLGTYDRWLYALTARFPACVAAPSPAQAHWGCAANARASIRASI